jgi:hypothetical protein
MKGETLKNRSIAHAAIILATLVFPCPALWAECSFTLQSAISSGWNKAGVAYTVDKNTLKIKVGEGTKNDTDSIAIGSIKDCSTLTITVAQISGEYLWGGKAIGFSFANAAIENHQWGNQASFPPPRGRAIEDGFIKSGLSNGTKLVYDIDSKTETTHIGAKVFIGSGNALELQFSAQQAPPREPQVSARQPSSRLPERYTAYTGRQPDMAANSCSSECHQPRTERDEFAFTRGVFRPSRAAACPDGNH